MLNLCCQFFIAFFLMMLTGFVLDIIWRFFYWVLKVRLSDTACTTLRFVCLFYIFPFGFVLNNLLNKNGYLQGDQIWQLNFRSTTIMAVVVLVLFICWIGMAVYIHFKYNVKDKRITVFDIPEEDPDARIIFNRAKKRLRVIWPIEIYRSNTVPDPRIEGTFCNRITLPYRLYSSDQLQIIYYHELIHYKHHDIFFKQCSAFAGMMLVFEKFAEHRNDVLDNLCEYHCDCSTIRALRGQMDARGYFNFVLACTRSSEKKKRDHTVANLAIDSTDLKHRIDFINERKQLTFCNKCFNAFISLCFVIFSIIISYVLGSRLSFLYDSIYETTEYVEVKEKREFDEPVLSYNKWGNTSAEFTAINEKLFTNTNTGIITMEVVPLESNTYYVSESMCLERGQFFTINGVVMPDTKVCRVGIINEANSEYSYIDVSSAFENEFTIQEQGQYRFFVQNQGDETFSVSANIIINEQ